MVTTESSDGFFLTGNSGFIQVKLSDGWVSSLENCAAACAASSEYFIYGQTSSSCNEDGCKCFCEVPGSTTCNQISLSHYNLYKKTISKACRPWRPKDNAWPGLSSDDRDHNHCRNPDGENGPWCYTLTENPNGKMWAYCTQILACTERQLAILPDTDSF